MTRSHCEGVSKVNNGSFHTGITTDVCPGARNPGQAPEPKLTAPSTLIDEMPAEVKNIVRDGNVDEPLKLHNIYIAGSHVPQNEKNTHKIWNNGYLLREHHQALVKVSADKLVAEVQADIGVLLSLCREQKADQNAGPRA